MQAGAGHGVGSTASAACPAGAVQSADGARADAGEADEDLDVDELHPLDEPPAKITAQSRRSPGKSRALPAPPKTLGGGFRLRFVVL